MADIVRLINDALTAKRVQHHFQPIWHSVNKSLLGFEALARFGDVNPEDVFEKANQIHLGLPLDRLSIQEALKEGQVLPGMLFVNINPNHLAQPQGPFGSVGLVVTAYRNRRAVVVEITEHTVDQEDVVEAGLTRMRRRGMALAIDDAGTGSSDSSRLAWIRPRYVKLARNLTDEFLSGNPQSMLDWITRSHDIGALVIAEGIEEEEIIPQLAHLGVDYIQGYAWGRPDSADAWVRQLHDRTDEQLKSAFDVFQPPVWPGKTPQLPALLSVMEIGELMYSMWPVPALIVDSNNRVVGMNLRAERQFGTALERVAFRPAEEVLGLEAFEPDLMHVSAVLPGELAMGEMIRQRIRWQRSDGQDLAALCTIVGVRFGNRPESYKLITLYQEAPVQDLTPSDLDPLTELSTRSAWEREAPDWDRQGGTLIFLDVDGLKQVNDLFGHAEGDRIIRDAGKIIRQALKETHGAAVRYGGDEFLIVLRATDVREAHQFAEHIKSLYQSARARARIPAGFSYGLATFLPGHLAEAIAAADRSLYEQKGLMLPSQLGSRLLLSASGRRALWNPIPQVEGGSLGLDRIIESREHPTLRQAFGSFIAPPPGISAIEVNAGRGQIGFVGGLVAQLGKGSQYLAVDRTGAYLTRVWRQWQEHPTAGGVHFLRAAAEHLPIVSQSADLSIIAFAMPQNKVGDVLKELIRVTRVQGAIALAWISQVSPSDDLVRLYDDALPLGEPVITGHLDVSGFEWPIAFIRQKTFVGRLTFATPGEASVWASGLTTEDSRPAQPRNTRFKAADALYVDYQAQFRLYRRLPS